MDKAFLLWFIMIILDSILLLTVTVRVVFNRKIGKTLLQATIGWTLVCNVIYVLFII